MITIKRLTECSLHDATIAWNTGFEGYYFNMTMTIDQFTNRLILEGLSPELSIIAYDDKKPVGFILNGIRVIKGKKVAWNGGTGVAHEYRGKGVGNLLMDAALAIYREHGVDIATLEAVKENKQAISLYEKKGYRLKDELVHLQHKGIVEGNLFPIDSVYKLVKGLPIDASKLPFYQYFVSWQTQWNNARDGEALIAYDQNESPIGYVIYKRRFNEAGEQVAVIVLQCKTSPTFIEKENVLRFLLNKVFAESCDMQQIFPNVSAGDEILRSLLIEAGFNVFVEQVYLENLI